MKTFVGWALSASMLVAGKSAAAECMGWTVTVLDKTTREVKTWCPSPEVFSFSLPGWEEASCSLHSVQTDELNLGTTIRSRWLRCSARGVVTANVATLKPSTGESAEASFIIANERPKKTREYVVTATYVTP